MRLARLLVPVALAAAMLACGGGSQAPSAPAAAAPAPPPVDPATAATVAVSVTFTGPAPRRESIRIDGDGKCVAANGARDIPGESIVLGENQALENVFVYVKDGLGRRAFPVPTEPVVLNQDKCRYTPRVFGIRVGQPLEIRNGDPLLHNVRSDAQVNQPFNMGQPQNGAPYSRTFTTEEVMVPFRCDVHGWMQAWAGVVNHPFFGVTGASGRVSLAGLPPGDYTIEAWHESLGTQTQKLTIGAKETRDVEFTFAR